MGTCGFMGTGAAKYAQRLRAVELNCTFHDQGKGCYEKQASLSEGVWMDLDQAHRVPPLPVVDVQLGPEIRLGWRWNSTD